MSNPATATMATTTTEAATEATTTSMISGETAATTEVATPSATSSPARRGGRKGVSTRLLGGPNPAPADPAEAWPGAQAELPSSSRDRVVHKTFNFSPVLLEELDRLPMNRSAALQSALRDAAYEPEKLIAALRHRMRAPRMWESENSVRVNTSLNSRVIQYAQELAKMTQLPIEQVVRLAAEAFVYRL